MTRDARVATRGLLPPRCRRWLEFADARRLDSNTAAWILSSAWAVTPSQRMETSKTCAYCSKPDALKICGRCRNQPYCSLECQRSDWRRHKASCAPGRAAAAATNEQVGQGRLPALCEEGPLHKEQRRV